MARISHRQLDHWTRRGYLRSAVEGAGSGVPRTFDETEIEVAILLACLSLLDMLGPSGGTAGRRSNYLLPLIDHVRENGLIGQFAIGAGVVTIDLAKIAEVAVL